MEFKGFHSEPTGQLTSITDGTACDGTLQPLSDLIKEIGKESTRLQAYVANLQADYSRILAEVNNYRCMLNVSDNLAASTFVTQSNRHMLTSMPTSANTGLNVASMSQVGRSSLGEGCHENGFSNHEQPNHGATMWKEVVKKALGAHMNDGTHSIKECWNLYLKKVVAEDEWLDSTVETHSSSETRSWGLDNVALKMFSDSKEGRGFTKAGRESERSRGANCLIHPDSRFSTAWTLASLALIFQELVMVSVDLFENRTTGLHAAMDSCILIFWCMDIFLHLCLIDIYVDGRLCSDRCQIAMTYGKSWFLFDVACNVPSLIVQLGDDTRVNLSRGFRLIKILRCSRIIKIRHFARAIQTMSLPLVHMLGELMLIILWIHISACIWFVLGSSTEDGWVALQEIQTDPASYKYFMSIHWAAAQLQGGTDVAPGYTAAERSYATFVIFLSIIILARFVSGLTSSMVEWQSVRLRYVRWREAQQKFADDGLAYPFIMLVRYHVNVSKSSQELQETFKSCTEALQLLPSALRRDVLCEWRRKTISVCITICAIERVHKRCFERICCDAFQQQWTMQDDQVFAYMQLGARMYIVVDGCLHYHMYRHVMPFRQVFAFAKAHHATSRICEVDDVDDLEDSNSKVMTTPPDGNHSRPEFTEGVFAPKVTGAGAVVSEAVLWTYWSHAGDWINAGPCSLLVLSFGDFHSIVSAYPKPRRSLARHAEKFAKALNASPIEWKSDLLHSGIAMRSSGEEEHVA